MGIETVMTIVLSWLLIVVSMMLALWTMYEAGTYRHIDRRASRNRIIIAVIWTVITCLLALTMFMRLGRLL